MPTDQIEETKLPETMPELEVMITELEARLAACDQEQKDLMAAEDPANGVFHAAEIHANRQQKNQLEATRQFAQVRLNRLRMEAEPF